MGLLSSLISGAFNMFSTDMQVSAQKRINEQNLAFQRENLDYQKALQQEIFGREDTSYQRTVNDLRLAGLNPLSMNGTNGSGEAIATEPMHSDFYPNSSVQAGLDMFWNSLNTASNIKNNNTLTSAQASLINAQADNQRIKNLYEESILEKQLEGMNFENIGKRFSNERQNIAWLNETNNYLFNRRFGLSDNMPDSYKFISLLGNQFSDFDKSDVSSSYGRDWSDFGSTFNSFTPDSVPSFYSASNLLANTQLMGALQENKLGQILLSLLGYSFSGKKK